MVDLEGKKVGKTKATMTGLGSCYIAWKRKQKPKQQTNKLTSFMSRIVEAVSPSKRKK
jgi:4-diphosphocytidyl-2C-methyl-D-erythritol kinase